MATVSIRVRTLYGIIGIVLVPVLALLFWPEGASESRPSAATAEAKKVQLPAPSTKPVEVLYDSDGLLLPSDIRVAGLVLPRGLERTHEGERSHEFLSARVPLPKLLAYFGPRLMTGQVDRYGEGVVYRRAVPKEAKGGVVRLDVELMPRGSTTRVRIHEVPPVPTERPSEQELLKDFERSLKQLD